MKTWQWVVLGVGGAALSVVVYKLYTKNSDLLKTEPEEIPDRIIDDILSKTWFSDGGTHAINWSVPEHSPADNRITMSSVRPGFLELPDWFGVIVDSTHIEWINKANPEIIHTWASR